MAETEAWLAGITGRFHEPLRRCAAGQPANVALMQLLMECRSVEEAATALAAAAGSLDREGDQHGAGRLRATAGLLAAHPRSLEIVRSVLGQVDHGPGAETQDEAIALCAAAFDRAARDHPEGSVALYSLGNPALLQAATEEVVAHLDRWGVLPPDAYCLDIGCGIGRFEIALAGRVARIVGIDISAAMIEESRKRCGYLVNVEFHQTAGGDLSPFPNRSFDLVLGSDSFPYLVQAGGDLAATMIAEAARVLRPGGHLAILNYSYRSDLAADCRDIAAHAARNGLEVVRNGTAEFNLWDAAAFLLQKPR